MNVESMLVEHQKQWVLESEDRHTGCHRIGNDHPVEGRGRR